MSSDETHKLSNTSILSAEVEAITRACNAVVKEYRWNQVSKGAVLQSILKKLAHLQDTARLQPISQNE